MVLQNSCAARENRIQKKLCQLILEAARRRDEKASLAASAGTPSPAAAESPARVRSRIEKALGAGGGVEAISEDPSWRDRLLRISQCGERLKFGKLTLACLNWGDSRDHIIRPGEPPLVIVVGPKCPREKLMQLLGE
jgi:hypothetical protein